ncbi:phospholipase D-like domain-containing protein, partial [Salmonella enterica]
TAFAPWDDIEALIVGQLHSAQRQILMQAYLLTSRQITDELVAARKRGIDVRVLMDAGQLDKNSEDRLRQLRAAGIPVWLETDYR